MLRPTDQFWVACISSLIWHAAHSYLCTSSNRTLIGPNWQLLTIVCILATISEQTGLSHFHEQIVLVTDSPACSPHHNNKLGYSIYIVMLANSSFYLFCGESCPAKALMFFTRLAVLLATSFAAVTKCFLATGLVVLWEAVLHALHNTLVCFAMTVAAASTYNQTHSKP